MKTFQDDDFALQVIRNKINEEYKKCKTVSNPAAIQELNKFAEEVEHELRTTVIQAVEKESGTFELRIQPDTLVDNAVFEEKPKDCKGGLRSDKDDTNPKNVAGK
ncbi:complex III assembly factor LYRM7 isoform X2 [Ceratina calcarata]|nr:complex III assembly factor LYRM7 isoform X2 [Ceratina calcarata]